MRNVLASCLLLYFIFSLARSTLLKASRWPPPGTCYLAMQSPPTSTTSCLSSKGEPSPPLVSTAVFYCYYLHNSSVDCAVGHVQMCICTNIYCRFYILFPLTGYALDPSVGTTEVSNTSYIGAVDEAEKNKGKLLEPLIELEPRSLYLVSIYI